MLQLPWHHTTGAVCWAATAQEHEARLAVVRAKEEARLQAIRDQYNAKFKNVKVRGRGALGQATQQHGRQSLHTNQHTALHTRHFMHPFQGGCAGGCRSGGMRFNHMGATSTQPTQTHGPCVQEALGAADARKALVARTVQDLITPRGGKSGSHHDAELAQHFAAITAWVARARRAARVRACARRATSAAAHMPRARQASRTMCTPEARAAGP